MNTYYTRSVQAFENRMQPTRLVVGRSRLRNYMSSPSRSPVGPAQYIPLLLSPHFELPQTGLGSAITCSLSPHFCHRSKTHLAGTGRGQRAERQWVALPVSLHTRCGMGPWAGTRWEVSEGCSRRAGEAEMGCRMLREKTSDWNLVWTCKPTGLRRWSDTYTSPIAGLGDRCLVQEWINFPHFVILNGMTIKSFFCEHKRALPRHF